MPLSFPVPVVDFFDPLTIVSSEFADFEPMKMTRLADGSVLKASLGANLWRGRVTLAPANHGAAAAIEAKLSVLRRAGSSFLVYDTRFNGPQADPGGAGLSGFTPTIQNFGVDRREFSLENLPPQYDILPGDMVGVQYGTPARYSLHRIVTGDKTGAGGKTAQMEVTPIIPDGVMVLSPVTLVRPVIKAIMINPQYGAAANNLTGGASFEFIQTVK